MNAITAAGTVALDAAITAAATTDTDTAEQPEQVRAAHTVPVVADTAAPVADTSQDDEGGSDTPPEADERKDEDEGEAAATAQVDAGAGDAQAQDAAKAQVQALIARVTAAASLGRPMEVARERIVPSPTNPRRTFDGLDALAATVAEHGIMQPLLVRPHPTQGEGWYEIVAGERRWRASAIANLDVLPVLVRDLTDAQAAMLQAIENVQRSDLNAMEEAAGYEQLQHRAAENGQPPLSVEEIARLTGKKYRDVLRSIKLLALNAAGRAALLGGKISAGVGFLLARVPAAVQDDALKAVTNSYGGPIGESEAGRILRDRFMTALKIAVFDTTDPMLVPAAGACGPCPKRTGNAGADLFGDVDSGAVCTDTGCFATKRRAHFTQLRKTAEANGQRVIVGEAARALKPKHYGPLKGYVKLDDTCYGVAGYKTYRQLLGKKVRDVVLIESGDALEEYLPDAQAREQLAARGHKVGAKLDSSTSEDQRQKERVAKRETKVRRAAYERIRAADYAPNGDDMLRLAAHGLWKRSDHETAKAVATVYGWSTDYEKKHVEAAKCIAAMDVAALGRFVQALMIEPELRVSAYHDTPSKTLDAAAKMAGVDVAAMRREALAEATAKAAKADAKKAGTLLKATVTAPAAVAVPAKGKGKASAAPVAATPATPAKAAKVAKVKPAPVKRAAGAKAKASAPATAAPASVDAADVTPASAWPFPPKALPPVVASAPEARSEATPEPVAVQPVDPVEASAPVVAAIEREPVAEAQAPDADEFSQDGIESEAFAQAADFDADSDAGYTDDPERDD